MTASAFTYAPRFPAAQPGTAYLVGAGPGDPGLLTLRAVELLRSADVILHDKLIPAEALQLAHSEASLEDVGKTGGGHQTPQDITTARLVEHCLAGRSVVRLKGGDPFVFGRGGEEAQACVAAGIPFEVVPGVTAGVAVPAYAGIPVTQRTVSPAVAFITGHEDPAKPETQLNWPALAMFPGTLIFYMGVRALPRISEQLIAAGRSADEPAAIIQRGTLSDQRVVTGPLSQIPAIAAEAKIGAPAITLVGAVAALHEELAWLDAARPLDGISVAVTRARAQASELAARLRSLGARVVEAPAIRTEDIPFEIPPLDDVDLLVFTSPSGVVSLFRGVADARALAGPRIAAIGPGTAAALRERGIEPEIVPVRSASEGIIDALGDSVVQRAVVVRAVEGRDVLLNHLRSHGTDVTLVSPYRTVPETLPDELRDGALACDYALFASGSSARALHAAAGSLNGPRIVSIGPSTSAVLQRLGATVAVEADPHTPDGLIAALVQDAG